MGFILERNNPGTCREVGHIREHWPGRNLEACDNAGKKIDSDHALKELKVKNKAHGLG